MRQVRDKYEDQDRPRILILEPQTGRKSQRGARALHATAPPCALHANTLSRQQASVPRTGGTPIVQARVQISPPSSTTGCHLSPELDDQARMIASLGRLGRLLVKPGIKGKKSTMRVKDQHLDIFCRYAYPIAYAIVLMVFFLSVADARPPTPFYDCDSPIP